MIKKVNNMKFNENHLKIINLFTKGYNKEYYIREIGKILKISSRTSLLILNELEKKTILKSNIKGKIRLFKINKSIISKEYFNLAETYKKIMFLEQNLLIKEIIEKIIPLINGMTIIFGSYSKGLQKKESDLDLLIVGDCQKSKIIEISKIYGIEINIKKYSLDIFKKELYNNILLKEVLENHIIIYGIEKFIGEINLWKK